MTWATAFDFAAAAGIADTNEVVVSLIPEPLERSTLGAFEVGSIANHEVDAQTQTIVNTVRET